MCDHYKRNCNIICPQCNEDFACRHCHNLIKYEQEIDINLSHNIDRKLIKEVICRECDTRQTISNLCINCGISFGVYFCSICNYFDNEDKGQFHCGKCGICRVGGRENFFHCDKCNACYSNSLKDNHICIDNSMNQNCVICMDDLFNSTKGVSVLKCGHTIHADCLNEYLKSNYKCPICQKSIHTLYFNYIQQEIDNTIMPEEYKDVDKNITCNDCNKQSIHKFHIIAMKCIHCNSFNTKEYKQ